MIIELNTIQGWLAVVTFVVVGGVAIYGIFDKARRERTKQVEDQADQAGSKLVNILQETVDELDKKVTEQSRQIVTLEKKVGDLEKTNEDLTKVLQGRDQQTQDFYKQSAEARMLITETHTLVKSTTEQITKVAALMEGFMKATQTILNH